MSEITTRKKLDISTFHAHAGITRSVIEGTAESTSNKTLRTRDISQEALGAAVASYTYSTLPPAPPTQEELDRVAALVALKTKLGLTDADIQTLRSL